MTKIIDRIIRVFEKLKLYLEKTQDKKLTDRFHLLAHHPRFRIFAIIVSVSMVLAFVLSPAIIYFSVPDFKVGFVATTDIKADREFLIEDKDATEQRRIEEVDSVRAIFDYDPDMPIKITTNLSNAFLAMANVYANFESNITSDESKKTILLNRARKDFESAIGFALTDNQFNSLSRLKYSLDITNDIARLIFAVYNEAPFINEYFSPYDLKRGITIRDIKTQNEKDLNNLTSVISIRKIDPLLLEKTIMVMKNSEKDIQDTARVLAKKIIRPNLTISKNATEERKKKAFDNVKPVYFKILKNETLLKSGDKITPEILSKLNAYFEQRGGSFLSSFSIFIGLFLIILLISFVLYFFIADRIKFSDSYANDILFIGIVAILQLLIVKAGISLSESAINVFKLVPSHIYTYAIPFAAGPMLVAVLTNRYVGLVISFILSVLVMFLFEEHSTIFLYAVAGSIFAAHNMSNCNQRSTFFKTGIIIGAINSIVILCISLINGHVLEIETVYKFIMAVASGLIASFIVLGLIPLFEFIFGYTSAIRLLELANLNQPIFQKMIMTAPGTYHHSVIVASMSEAASEAIESDTLLAKVSAYYHDMGKIKKPQYFIENQDKSENKHDKLSPDMSKLIIISHLKDGREMAKELKLGNSIQDIIQQHHGTRFVTYFLEKAKQEYIGTGKTVYEDDFRYPGPKPQTKEAAIVLLADVIEAAARTLNNPAPSRIKNLVETLIKQILLEGQLDESDLTLRDLEKISESFTKILSGIFHHRIDYMGSPVYEINDKKETNANFHK